MMIEAPSGGAAHWSTRTLSLNCSGVPALKEERLKLRHAAFHKSILHGQNYRKALTEMGG